MTYQLNRDIPLAKNISRIASEEIEGCFNALDTLDIHEAVHEFRKRFKKIRALARLVRDEIGEEKYREINIYFRDLGQEISDLRDLSAHVETLNILNERYGGFLYVRFFNTVIKQFEKERNTKLKELRSRNYFSDYLINKLEYAQNNLVNWPVNSTDLKVILPSIERVYIRGQKALKNALLIPSMEFYHEWRKRVKYLWYQTLLLQEIWPQLFDTLESEICQLADYLGKDHDLMVLQKKLISDEIKFRDLNHLELMHGIIEKYSQILRKEARTSGALIYAENPGDFIKIIGNYTEINRD